MILDPPTLFGCSTIVFLLFGFYFVIAEESTDKRRQSFWYACPFLIGGVSSMFLTAAAIHKGGWRLIVANLLCMIAYAAAWQAIRVMVGWKPRMAAALIPCAPYLAISILAGETGLLHVISCAARVLLISGYTACAAWNLRKSSLTLSTSELHLYRILSIYVIIYFTMAVLTPFLPEPFGSLPRTLRAITAYNLISIIEIIMVALAMIAIPRERVAAKHQQLTLRDPLSNAGNRRAMDEWMQQNDESNSPGAVLVLDIDHFKAINDAYGHATGDQIIIMMSQICEHALPSEASFFRVGGEEFVAILFQSRIKDVQIIANRMREAFSRETVMVNDQPVKATLSVGGAVRLSRDTSWPELLSHADAALYTAKRSGRNNVFIAPHPVMPLRDTALKIAV